MAWSSLCSCSESAGSEEDGGEIGGPSWLAPLGSSVELFT